MTHIHQIYTGTESPGKYIEGLQQSTGSRGLALHLLSNARFLRGLSNAPTLLPPTMLLAEGPGASPEEEHANMTRALEMLAAGSLGSSSAKESEFTRLRKQQVFIFLLVAVVVPPASALLFSCYLVVPFYFFPR